LSVDGILLLDKPSGPTTAYCVRAVSRRMGVKAGHAGTLDPMATGLVIALLGRATKLSPFISGFDKRYTGRIRLGMQTSTGDSDGEIIDERNVDVDENRLIEIAGEVRGELELEVPIYSAIKLNGKHLYEYARKGEKISLPSRKVSIKKFEIVDIDLPFVSFETDVSKGTYIRSLAEHIGKLAGCGACLVELRRTIIGEHRIENAVKFDEALEMADSNTLADLVIDPESALSNMPRIALDRSQAVKISHGVFTAIDIDMLEFGTIFYVCYNEKLIAVLKNDDNGKKPYTIERVFARSNEI